MNWAPARRSRVIGPIGTALRVCVGVALLYVAGAVWDVSWYDPVVGFVALPGVMTLIGLTARSMGVEAIRFTGVLGHLANLAVIVVLLQFPLTSGGAMAFYGISMLVAAWRGQGRCEATVLSNLILRRGDQIGCPLFVLPDELEARFSRTGVAVR